MLTILGLYQGVIWANVRFTRYDVQASTVDCAVCECLCEVFRVDDRPLRANQRRSTLGSKRGIKTHPRTVDQHCRFLHLAQKFLVDHVHRTRILITQDYHYVRPFGSLVFLCTSDGHTVFVAELLVDLRLVWPCSRRQVRDCRWM